MQNPFSPLNTNPFIQNDISIYNVFDGICNTNTDTNVDNFIVFSKEEICETNYNQSEMSFLFEQFSKPEEITYMINDINKSTQSVDVQNDYKASELLLSIKDATNQNINNVEVGHCPTPTQVKVDYEDAKNKEKNDLSTDKPLKKRKISDNIKIKRAMQNIKKLNSKDTFDKTSLSTQMEEIFVLVSQPNAIQRKSYNNEARWIIPYPKIICCNRSITGTCKHHFKDAVVNTYITDIDGNIIANQNDLIRGDIEMPFKLSCLQLKVRAIFHSFEETRLLIRIKYSYNNELKFKEFLTNPFYVYSRRFNKNKIA